MTKLKFTKGYSILEVMITVAILTLIIGAIGIFQSDIFSLNRLIQIGLNNQYEAKNIIRPFTGEVREAVSSAQGSYALVETGTSSFIFYSDIDNDLRVEKIRYFLDGNTFKKGIIEPNSDSFIYDQNTEQIIQVVHNVVSDNIFEYFDSSYDGTASTSALIFPVNPSDVRLVKVRLQIYNDSNKGLESMLVETQVSIRNLKDNR